MKLGKQNFKKYDMTINDVVGGYVIKSIIPGAGMAQVFKVEKEGNLYVLKTVQNPDDEIEVKRFKREARIMLGIQDKHVIEILDSNLNVKEPYYVMPLCERSLAERVSIMTEMEKLDASIQFCEGIKAIHDSGVTHRDIKPKNALCQNGIIKITDLGLGRLVNRDSTTLTLSGQYGGTDGYIPPEFRKDEDSFRNGSVQGDIYMIGKSLYFIFSGGCDPSNVRLEKVNPIIGSIISTCTQEEPTLRYDDVDKILSELKAFKKAQIQWTTSPKPLDEILIANNRTFNSTFAEEVYNYFCSIGTDNADMAISLKKLSNRELEYIFQQKQDKISTFVNYFDESIRNCSGWIQCEDVEEFARLAYILMPLCQDMLAKQKLLALSIDYAKGYNRWAAMTTVGKMLALLSSEDIKLLYPFLVARKDDIKEISSCFKTPIPISIKNIIK